ncbi:serine palmitoyltransferase [Lactarius pseudohatsudake]|nr:serine palmitoyltransferase [Lactarius pseudohatsudake]
MQLWKETAWRGVGHMVTVTTAEGRGSGASLHCCGPCRAFVDTRPKLTRLIRNPANPASCDASLFNIEGEEALSPGVHTMHGQKLVEDLPCIRLSITVGLSRKECEHAGDVIKAAVAKVLAKRSASLIPEEQSGLASVSVVSGANVPRRKLTNTGKHVLNLASYNLTGLAGNEVIKVRAIDPPEIWDINFAIQRGLQISCSTVRWFDHNDLKSLEDVLLSIEKERRKRRGPLTRRFIVTEDIFGKDGAMVNLPKLIELKHKHKYRLILDESISFGTVGRTGRGLTELYNVPATQIDMIIGLVANTLNSSWGFCAGSPVPALLAVSASEGINILRNTPSILSTLQENAITIPSHPASPIIHIYLWSAATLSASTSLSAKPPNPAIPAPRDAPSFDIPGEERLLQDIVEALAQGVWITRARRLRGQELVEARPSIRLAITTALSRKECERAASVIKAAVVKVVTKRK